MKFNRFNMWPSLVLISCAFFSMAMTGCQSTVGGQTLPSSYYLKDDVQFFPAGPEFILSNQVQALEQYKLDRQAVEAGLGGAGQ